MCDSHSFWLKYDNNRLYSVDVCFMNNRYIPDFQLIKQGALMSNKCFLSYKTLTLFVNKYACGKDGEDQCRDRGIVCVPTHLTHCLQDSYDSTLCLPGQTRTC